MLNWVKAWIVVLATLSFQPLCFGAGNCTSIANSPKGPLQSLINAGKSRDLLPYLQHSDGRVVQPSEYRRLSEKFLCLPSSAKPDAVATQALLLAAQYYNRAGQVRDATTSAAVKNLQKQLDDLKKHNADLQNRLTKAIQDLGQDNDRIASLTAATRFRVYWWWLLVAVIVGGALVLGYRRIFYPEPVIGTAGGNIHNQNYLKQMEAELESVKSQLQELRNKWKDPGAVAARHEQLKFDTAATQRTMNHPSP